MMNDPTINFEGRAWQRSKAGSKAFPIGQQVETDETDPKYLLVHSTTIWKNGANNTMI